MARAQRLVRQRQRAGGRRVRVAQRVLALGPGQGPRVHGDAARPLLRHVVLPDERLAPPGAELPVHAAQRVARRVGAHHGEAVPRVRNAPARKRRRVKGGLPRRRQGRQLREHRQLRHAVVRQVPQVEPQRQQPKAVADAQARHPHLVDAAVGQAQRQVELLIPAGGQVQRQRDPLRGVRAGDLHAHAGEGIRLVVVDAHAQGHRLPAHGDRPLRRLQIRKGEIGPQRHRRAAERQEQHGEEHEVVRAQAAGQSPHEGEAQHREPARAHGPHSPVGTRRLPTMARTTSSALLCW